MSTPDYENTLYQKHKHQLKLVEDFYCGVDTARLHLDQFPMENDTKYKDRQSRASLANYVLQTTETVTNIVFRKDINQEGVTNSRVKDWLNDIDFKQNINEFSKEVLSNRVRDGFTFIVVDSPSYDPEVVNSDLIAKELNIRPYFVNILRKNVINWKLDKFGNYERFTFREFYTDTTNRYREEEKEQIKVMFNDGTVEIWREDKLFQTINTGINQIPVVKIGDDLIPPLYDQTKINSIHFNQSSQYDNYVEVGSAPFLAVYAYQADEAPKTLGINDGLTFSDRQSGGAEWIEMSGSNANIIKDRIQQHELAMLNIAVTFATSSNVKTATQVEMESTEDESKLVNYSSELEDGLNTAIEMLQLFETTSLGENIVAVNRDFNSNILTEQQVSSFMMLYTQGVISSDRLIGILERGEVLETLEDAEALREKQLLNDESSD